LANGLNNRAFGEQSAPENALPEVIGLVLALALALHGHTNQAWSIEGWIALGLRLAQLIRIAWLARKLIHGAGHATARALVDWDPRAFTIASLLEQRSAGALARLLFPFAPIGLTKETSRPIDWMDIGDPTPWKVRIKAGGGIDLSLVICLLVVYALWHFNRSDLAAGAALNGGSHRLPFAMGLGDTFLAVFEIDWL